MSYLSQPELDALNASELSRTTPFLIQGVSHGYFSIARYYGAAKFNGSSYAYIPEHDELVRDDVVKFVAKLRKPKRKVKSQSSEAQP